MWTRMRKWIHLVLIVRRCNYTCPEELSGLLGFKYSPVLSTCLVTIPKGPFLAIQKIKIKIKTILQMELPMPS